MSGRNKIPTEVRQVNIKRAHTASWRRRAENEKAASATKKAAGLTYHVKHTPHEDIEARLAEIPADTRGLTARICGDPIPERSALYRRARMIEEQR